MSEDLPKTADAFVAVGVAHHAAGRPADAEAAMREALRRDPQHVEALSNLGALLRGRGQTAQALEALDRAFAIAPASPAVLLNRANLLNDLRRWSDALEAATAAVAAAPASASALNALGNARSGLGDRPAAIASYREALRIAPDDAAARFNLAKALLELGDATAALAAYAEVARLRPEFAGAHAGLGHAFAQLKRWGEAAAACERAHELDPELPYLAGQRLFARMKVCDWRDFDALVADLEVRIDAGKPAATPFSIAAAPLSAGRQLRCAETYSSTTFRASPRPAGAPAGPRIRLGYFSADFHDHATAYLIAEMLELHDRSAFEVTAFSFGPASDGQVRARLIGACERFFDVRALGTQAICDMARHFGIDVAVDLKGYTTHSRPEIFARGAAPVQASFLGYPMTMGAPFIDYLIADRVLVGPADRRFYSEKVAWLPHCYQPNDRKRAIAGEATRRGDHGLPADGAVFASFNGSYKITPQVFGVWMELLQALPQSVLWLLQDDPDATANLRRSAAAAGVDAERLVFAPFCPLPAHLERIGHADLFLDSFPCSAHTTASDALWAGLPLVTRKGETFASRVAASLLGAVGLADLAVSSLAAYKALALALARDPAVLRAIRARLVKARTSSPLFDTPAYVRGLEDLYRRMHERRLAGLPPDHME